MEPPKKLDLTPNKHPNPNQFLEKYQFYDLLQTWIMESNRELTQLPVESIKNKTKQLKKLQIAQNKIQNLEEFLEVLYSQQPLDLQIRKQTLKNLPKLNTHKLTSLRLIQNKLQSIDNLSSGEFPQLDYIFVHMNLLKRVPAIKALKLKDVNFQKNQITDITDFAQIYMPRLQQVNFQNNKLTVLPQFHAPKMFRIFCKNNKITDISQFEKSLFPSINQFQLSFNKIQKIPVFHSLQPLSSLRFLLLNKNNITNIEGLQFMNAPILTLVNLQRNLITQVNKTFNKIRFPYLQNLNIANNLVNEFLPSRCQFGTTYRLQMSVQSENKKRSLEQKQFYNDFYGNIEVAFIKLNNDKVKVIKYRYEYKFDRGKQNVRKNIVNKYGCHVSLINNKEG